MAPCQWMKQVSQLAVSRLGGNRGKRGSKPLEVGSFRHCTVSDWICGLDSADDFWGRSSSSPGDARESSSWKPWSSRFVGFPPHELKSFMAKDRWCCRVPDISPFTCAFLGISPQICARQKPEKEVKGAHFSPIPVIIDLCVAAAFLFLGGWCLETRNSLWKIGPLSHPKDPLEEIGYENIASLHTYIIHMFIYIYIHTYA